MIFPKPFRLRRQVPIEYIAFRILEAPWDNNNNIPLTDPGAFLDFSFDPPHSFDPIMAPDTYVICPHHQVGTGKLFPVLLLRKSHPDKRGAIRV